MTESTLYHADLLKWLKANEWLVLNGFMPRYHAIFGDTPYFLGSIARRFGADNAAPAKYGRDGLFQRQSRGFMGQTWDGFSDVWEYQAWVTEFARLMLSYVYPGAVLALYGGTRTYHRIAAGVEDAGWEIFDEAAAYLYGSGFPKSLNIGKAIDKKVGAERPVIGVAADFARDGHKRKTDGSHVSPSQQVPKGDRWSQPVTVSATAQAARWEGHGTALKPSRENIVLARAPRHGRSFADLASTYGTGALNIDGTRIGTADDLTRPAIARDDNQVYGRGLGVGAQENPIGRWPANTLFACECAGAHEQNCPVRLLDEQSGDLPSNGRRGESGNGERTGLFGLGSKRQQTYFDSGGASRFFYVAKAASWEREAGLDGFTLQTVDDGREKSIDNLYLRGETERRNIHPTVKSIQLNTYLARLLLPPELDEPRRILVPFAGVGSEMIGCHFAGWDVVDGVEMTAEYIPINNARRAWWEQFRTYEQAQRAAGADTSKQAEQIGQMDIFGYLQQLQPDGNT